MSTSTHSACFAVEPVLRYLSGSSGRQLLYVACRGYEHGASELVDVSFSSRAIHPLDLTGAMSGAEVIGILFNVYPLLCTAVQHYEDALDPFVRYRNFSSKVQRIHDELETERTIFRTECLLLLAATINRDTASKMLSDPQHPSWKNDALQKKFSYQLGSLGYACETVISQLDEKLFEIQRKAGELSTAASQPADKETIGDRKWRHRISKKLKFAMSDLGIQRALEDLQKLNKTFLTLSSQVVRLENKWPQSLDSREQPQQSHKTSQVLATFQMLQKASHSLYESLAQACTKHTHHFARLSLDATKLVANPSSKAQQIRFKLAYQYSEPSKHPDQLAEASRGDFAPMHVYHATIPARSNVSSEVVTAVASDNVPKPSRDHAKNIGTDVQRKIASDMVSWFEVESTPSDAVPIYSEEQPPALVLPSTSIGTTNVSMVADSDFCAHQVEVSARGPCTCLLSQTTYKHIVHHPSPSLSAWSQQKVLSLATSITSTPSLGWRREMPQFERLNIARTLAMAVLRFYSTPWLIDSWHSDGIFLFSGSDAPGALPEKLHSPFISVKVASVSTKGKTVAADVSKISMAHVVPNLLLFRLGIIFLELAYSATFNALRTSYLFNNIVLPPEESAADFVRARMLADGVGTLLGIDFATIVKKCLRCDFGCGEDLTDPKLRVRLYEDVVCKLEYLEDGFRKLQAPA